MGSAFSIEQAYTRLKSIGDLSQEVLAKIFSYLPPYERLLVSEVCKRWNVIVCAISWNDIRTVDLSSTPVKNIHTILKRCPNLKTVVARGKSFDSTDLHVLSRIASLASVKLYKSFISVPISAVGRTHLFPAMFSERLTTSAAWSELILYDFEIAVSGSSRSGFAAGSLPVSLQRLQISGVKVTQPFYVLLTENAVSPLPNFFDGLGRLQNLTCLILSSLDKHSLVEYTLAQSDTFGELVLLKNLRELCVGCDNVDPEPITWDIDVAPLHLPTLEVLFLHNILILTDETWACLTIKHPSLRILVITGHVCDEREIPERRLYPNGFEAAPLPLLRVFVGKRNSEVMRFTKSSTDALQLYPITEPLPEFLEREDIAPIFDGVWIAAQIKEGAKFGQKLWEYGGDGASSVNSWADE